MIIGESRRDAVINHDPVFIGEHRVTGPTTGLLEKTEGIKPIHELGGIGPPELNAP